MSDDESVTGSNQDESFGTVDRRLLHKAKSIQELEKDNNKLEK